MAAFQTSLQDRRDSPGLALNLASNNPFRRAVSPQPPSYNSLSPHTPSELDDRRASTNPFLDSYKPQSPSSKPVPPRPAQPYAPSSSTAAASQPIDRSAAGRTTDLFADLSLERQQSHPERSFSRRAPYQQPPQHRHTHSQEEQGAPQTAKKDPWDVFASPPRQRNGPTNENMRPRPRVRRNSESSMMDFKDEDRRRRERRPGDQRERPDRREGREPRDGRTDRDSSSRNKQSSSSSKKVRPARGLDLIDKLDITGIYGPGMIHHDGPFDACNPHRNRKGHRAAPMEAFPEGSQNMKMGGSGPVRKHLDYDMFHGRTQDAYADFSATSQVRPGTLPPRPARTQPDTRTGVRNPNQGSWDAKERVEQVHGTESAGLGTSTFFEGTPVSRLALQQRRESENDDMPSANGGLQRKRSIAQKIRGMSRPRQGWGAEGAVVRSPDRFPGSPTYDGPQSAGGRVRMNETSNPYFADAAVEKKPSTHVTIAPTTSNGTATASGSGMPRSRARTNTNGSSVSAQDERRGSDEWGLGEREQAQKENKPAGSGLLGRVKSLRGKKSRPERFGTA